MILGNGYAKDADMTGNVWQTYLTISGKRTARAVEIIHLKKNPGNYPTLLYPPSSSSRLAA